MLGNAGLWNPAFEVLDLDALIIEVYSFAFLFNLLYLIDQITFINL